MIFDKILAKLFFERKMSFNTILSVIAVLNLFLYFILVRYVIKPSENSVMAFILVFTVFSLFFFYRMYTLKKYLTALFEQLK